MIGMTEVTEAFTGTGRHSVNGLSLGIGEEGCRIGRALGLRQDNDSQDEGLRRYHCREHAGATLWPSLEIDLVSAIPQLKEKVRPMRRNRNGGLGMIFIALALLATACGSDGETREGPTIIIGSANFSENALVAEIYAQVLEDEGYPVERRLNVGQREVYAPALESGDLDLVPEYVGSALGVLFGGTPTGDSEATTQALRDAWAPAGISVLDPAPAQDKNGLVVLQETADSLGLSKTSDLADYADLVLGGPPECPNRPFCLLGFNDVYGISFADFKPLDSGGALTVAALEGREIDVALLFTSDGVIAAKGLVLLEDDKDLQPAENLTPVIRTELLDEYGDELADTLNDISAELTTADLSDMNKRIGIDGEDPKLVAADWISENL
jgi:osmoprotectant transport system substrate-binding protein